MNPDQRMAWLKLFGVTLLWFLMTKYLVSLGNVVVPDSVKVKISYQSFRLICQVITLGAGLLLAYGLLRSGAWEMLGLKKPKGLHFAGTLLVAPGAFVMSSYLALQIALPTLMEELATRGPGVSRKNAGAMGQMLTQSPLLFVIVSAAVLGALGEEFLFRGALWSAIERLFVMGRQAVTQKRTGQAKEEIEPIAPVSPLKRRLIDALPGTVATVLCAYVFGQMHADMPGGVGLVRVASTTILGFLCGLGRQFTGSIWSAVALHLLNNLLTIGTSRKWFASSEAPVFEGIPNSLVALSVTGLAALAVLAAVLRVRSANKARAQALDDAIADKD